MTKFDIRISGTWVTDIYVDTLGAAIKLAKATYPGGHIEIIRHFEVKDGAWCEAAS